MPFRKSVFLLFVALAFGPFASAQVDYLRDVKPILTQHCVRCHGADKDEAGLRVDTAEALFLGGDSGPLVKAGRPDASLLIRIVTGPHEDIPQMPYKRPPLAAAEIAVLRGWIAAGATAPEREEPGRFVHWAFVPPRAPALPVVRDAAVRHPIDRFVLARLEREAIAPSPLADADTLLRRLHLDLIGLPPTPAEIEAFRRDAAADRTQALERLIDRLLASPHYGERWSRPWLDVARYADSNGYSIDAPRQIWKYRDWVVAALNRDLPFDRFVVEQLAGDLLPNPTVEQRIATGFNRNTQINQEGGIDPEQFRIEAVMDRVNTFGTAFLGLSLACAQCHDHKFDPLRQKDYYQIYAFFNNTVEDGHGESRPGGALVFNAQGEPELILAEDVRAAAAALRKHMDKFAAEVEAWRQAQPAESRRKKGNSTRAALDVPWEKQSFNQRRAVFPLARPDDAAFKALAARYTELDRRHNGAVSTLVMQELPQPRESVLFVKGDFTRPGEKVAPGTPPVLPAFRPADPARPTRLDLARWTVDPAHPLTARVFVNRVWQQYFGRGLVETENDFGTQGEPPTHPELLDWLATEFVRAGWSLKLLHRLIVTSATYRRASPARPDLELKDPLNKLLARQARLRLDAEVVRDVALTASGLLSRKLGGPPVYPPQPDGVMSLGQVKRPWVASQGDDRYRRGLYTHLWRATPHPAFAVFDAPDGFSTCTRRLRSNTPLQALTLLNDEQFFEFAGALARRIEAEAPADLPARVDYAFQLCLTRLPTAAERTRLVAAYEAQLASASGDAAARRREAWLILARALLNLDETITRE
jgi:hypothetical protein